MVKIHDWVCNPGEVSAVAARRSVEGERALGPNGDHGAPSRQFRPRRRRALDFLTFPVRAAIVLQRDVLGFSSLRSERFDYVAREVRGTALDVGCGPDNLFVRDWLDSNGAGIDVFAYDGLSSDQLVDDKKPRFPFADATFDTVTFIASLNHVPRALRDRELAEAYRVLGPGGNVVVTMGTRLAETAVHRLVHLYSRLGTHRDLDHERGMHDEEDYCISSGEIVTRLAEAGFVAIRRRRFATQWGLNRLFTGERA